MAAEEEYSILGTLAAYVAIAALLAVELLLLLWLGLFWWLVLTAAFALVGLGWKLFERAARQRRADEGMAAKLKAWNRRNSDNGQQTK
jgi:hypothetical protein